METQDSRIVFDYRALRLLMGIIAFALPIAVIVISTEPLTSISAAYYSDARDVFVGMLFIVGAFLFAYRGHERKQARASKTASLAALLVALFPTSCDGCDPSFASVTHYVAATVLFSILAYFCFSFFRKKIKGTSGKKGYRNRIYIACGCVMTACIVGLGAATVFVPDDVFRNLRMTYYGEMIALFAFGIAWMVSGKFTRFIADEDEQYRIFSKS